MSDQLYHNNRKIYPTTVLSDAVDSASDAEQGIAATPAAVKAAYELAQLAMAESSHWYNGVELSNASTASDAHSYSTCPDVKVGDIYLNTVNGNVYECTTAGSGISAKWTYRGCMMGPAGNKGDTGNGISSVEIRYASSTSGTVAPSTWYTSIPSVSEGSYLWTRIRLYYTNDIYSDPFYSVAKQGAKGDVGTAAGFGTPTVSVDANTGTPSATVTTSGSDTAKVFNFAFKNLKGNKGDKGDTGATGQTGATGARGSVWNSGTAMSGTSTTTGYYSYSGASNALVGDYYLNTTYGYVYRCTTAGSGTTAKWTYQGSIRGAAGTNATTTAVATTSANGLMSAADKSKLDGIAAGAQVNSVTGVKGAGETAYRTGNINITKSNIGLGNVDNTSDANKPISTAVQNALNDKLDGSWSDANGYANIGELTLDVSDLIGTVWGHLGINNEFAGLSEVANQVSDNRDAIDTKAPKSHASTATTYGIGTSSNYGHVKLSDSTSTTSGASGGIAATPTAVKAAYDKANIKKSSLSSNCDFLSTGLHIGNDLTSSNSPYNVNGIVVGDNILMVGSKYNFLFGSNIDNKGSFGGRDYVFGMGIGIKTALKGLTVGEWNLPQNRQLDHIFSVGRGTSKDNRSNAFRVDTLGNGFFTKSVSGTGADYAEYWEWKDGNPNAEDRVGKFVAFDGTKIRFATLNDDLRKLGIISGNPAVIGDNHADEWHSKYLTDVFGRYILTTETDADGNETSKLTPNPEYDNTQEYIPRERRKEWDLVGTHGKLVVYDDGTCQVDGFCKPTDGGIATASDDGFYVMERIDDTHIRVYLR